MVPLFMIKKINRTIFLYLSLNLTRTFWGSPKAQISSKLLIRQPNVSGFVILHPLPYLPYRVLSFDYFIQNTRKVTEE